MSEQEKAGEEAVVEVPEVVEEKGEVIAEESFEGLSSQERKMAEASGIKVEEAKVEEKKEEPKVEEKKEEVKEEVKEEFVEKTEEELSVLSPKEKGFYFRAKEEKQKRQKAQTERDSFKLQLRSLEMQLEEAKKTKVEEPKPLDIFSMADDEILTAGEAKKLALSLQEQGKAEKEKADSERAQAEKHIQYRNEKAQILDNLAKESIPQWDAVADLAREMLVSDTTGIYKERFNRLIDSNDPKENQELITFVETLGKLHPKYSEKISATVSKTKEEKITERIEQNLNKKPSSASVGGTGSRKIPESDLTIEDAVQMIDHNPDAWRKLRPETRRRLLGE